MTLIRIYGAGDASGYSLQDFVSYSDDWLSEFTHVEIARVEYALGATTPEHGRFFRRAVNFPSSQTAAAQLLNFKRPDGSFYFTNSAAGSDAAGLYVKRDDAQGGFVYTRLVTFGDVHGSGIGPPVVNPEQGGATYINEGGHLYAAAGATFTVDAPATGTDSNFVGATYDPSPSSLTQLFADKGNGGFWWDWSVATPGFGQFAGPALADYIPNRTWFEVWTHILSIPGTTNIPILEALQAATFLGRFRDLDAALQALQFRIEGGETFAANKYFYGSISDQRVKKIDSFTAGTSTTHSNFHWVGPFATEVYVDAKVAAITPGGGPTVLYEAATAAIGGSTGLIAGNVVCPETGELEFYFEGLTGSRQGGVAYARIPAARIRGAVSALTTAYNNDNENVLVIAHGANRGIGIAVQATTNYLMLNAQAAGNHYIRISHIA